MGIPLPGKAAKLNSELADELGIKSAFPFRTVIPNISHERQCSWGFR